MGRDITIINGLVYYQGYVVAELKESKVPAKIMDEFKSSLGYNGGIPRGG